MFTTVYWHVDNCVIEFAWQGYLLQGRGLIVIWRQGLDQHIGYVDHALVAELNDNRLVQALMPYLQHYHPHREMLCLMLGSDGAARLYRIWLDQSVAVDLTRESIKRSPEYDPSTLLNREYETRLYHHYGRKPYWEAER